jgi:hypothetical protein
MTLPLSIRFAHPDPGNEVGQGRLASEFAKSRVDLTPVIRRVGGDLKDRLRKRGRLCTAKALYKPLGPGKLNLPLERLRLKTVQVLKRLAVVLATPCMDGK